MHVVDHVPNYLVFDTMLPFHSLLSARVSEFLLFHYVVAHVSIYVVFYTTLPYPFIHTSQLDFRNLDFFLTCRSLHRRI